MCIFLYRRFICPVRPGAKVMPIPAFNEVPMMFPRQPANLLTEGVYTHTFEDGGVDEFEGRLGPGEPVGPKVVHTQVWVVRCSNPEFCLHAAVESEHSVNDILCEHYARQCPECAGDPELPFDIEPFHFNHIRGVDLAERLGQPEDAIAMLKNCQEEKARVYFRRLLKMIFLLLKIGAGLQCSDDDLTHVLHHLWQETFCKRNRLHCRVDAGACPSTCLGGQYPYIHNIATAVRKSQVQWAINSEGDWEQSVQASWGLDADGDFIITDELNGLLAHWSRPRNFPKGLILWYAEQPQFAANRRDITAFPATELLAAIERNAHDVMVASLGRNFDNAQASEWRQRLQVRREVVGIAMTLVREDPGLDNDVVVMVMKQMAWLLEPKAPAHLMPFPMRSSHRKNMSLFVSLLDNFYPHGGICQQRLVKAFQGLEETITLFRRNRDIVFGDAKCRISLAEVAALENVIPVAEAAADLDGGGACQICAFEFVANGPQAPCRMPCCGKIMCALCVKRVVLNIKIYFEGVAVGAAQGQQHICPFCRGVPKNFLPPDLREELGFGNQNDITFSGLTGQLLFPPQP